MATSSDSPTRSGTASDAPRVDGSAPGPATSVRDRPQTQADMAEQRLRELLVTLGIRPGEPLVESTLMEQLGVGRTPLREACNRLAIDRLVVIHPRRGTFASDINIADLAALTDLRAQLEGLAAERAATRATPAEREHMSAMVRESTAGVDPTVAMRHDHRVHEAIWAATHNPFLEESAARYHSLSTRIWYLFVDRLADVPDHVDELRPLVAHVVEGEAASARDLAVAHVRHFESAVMQLW